MIVARLTGTVDEPLNVGDVGFVDEDPDAFRRVFDQFFLFFDQPADGLRRQVFDVRNLQYKKHDQRTFPNIFMAKQTPQTIETNALLLTELIFGGVCREIGNSSG